MGIQRSLSARISSSNSLRYGLPVIAILIASLVSSRMTPYTGNGVGYVLLFPAVAFSAWYCGIGPAILAMVLGVVAATFGFIPRIHAFAYPDTAESIATLAFLLSCVIIMVMGESRRRQHEALRKSQSELELKVQERTADLHGVNQNLRELSARLLQMQDEERRRIARELHDSVGQMLAALSMNLSAVRTDIDQLARTAAALNDSESLVQEMVTEVRTISHLLHPPLLDEAGLSSALRWYVDGFAQRSGIKVHLDMPEDFHRLPGEMETAIFRVIQECLTNIHRHSGSPVAEIRVSERNREVLVEIGDKGRGIPQHKLEEMSAAGAPGVGVRGMQERLRQLGGKLEIQSSPAGTTVKVRLPIPEDSLKPDLTLDRSAAA
ncbi:MAG TPA: sensor histidine kinase [Candidatus Sulfotelmatobacter sp.]|nr:sensor histidine kinase [Candidatus Sulfotelmatobacter sp.]